LLGGRHLALLLDRFLTAQLAAFPVRSLRYDGGGFVINEKHRRPKLDRLVDALRIQLHDPLAMVGAIRLLADGLEQAFWSETGNAAALRAGLLHPAADGPSRS
jgi:hypothetical protein